MTSKPKRKIFHFFFNYFILIIWLKRISLLLVILFVIAGIFKWALMFLGIFVILKIFENSIIYFLKSIKTILQKIIKFLDR